MNDIANQITIDFDGEYAQISIPNKSDTIIHILDMKNERVFGRRGALSISNHSCEIILTLPSIINFNNDGGGGGNGAGGGGGCGGEEKSVGQRLIIRYKNK